MKYLRVLEDAALIARTKEGREVSCKLSTAPMKQGAAWMSPYEKFWSDKLDLLARYVISKRSSRHGPRPPRRKALPRPQPRVPVASDRIWRARRARVQGMRGGRRYAGKVDVLSAGGKAEAWRAHVVLVDHVKVAQPPRPRGCQGAQG